MHSWRHTLRMAQAGAVVLGLLLLLAGVAAVTAQEHVHQWLEHQVGPGPSTGAATAPVLMEEFSDFQCGYCGKFARETLPRWACVALRGSSSTVAR